MAIVTEVRFAHTDGALADTLTALPDLDVRVIREASTDPKQSVYFLRFDADDPDAVETVLEQDHTVSTVTPMPEFEDQHLWGVEFSDDAKLMNPQVTSLGGFVADARAASPGNEPRGWHERWLLPHREALHDIWEHAREEGFDFEILELRRQDRADTEYPGPNALTEQQQVALTVAYEQGYFQEPREASLEEVAESLDLSASAVGGRLKRGMRSLIEGTLVVDRPEE